MSSHYTVKDYQHPALIICNGQSCDRLLLDQLLQWSPLVIVLDSAIERVLPLGVKVDVLLGDFDRSMDFQYYQNYFQSIEIHSVPNQDKTDLEKAFDFLLQKGIESVNLVWSTGKRLDHTLNNVSSMAKYKSKLKIVGYDDNSVFYFLPKKFKKWYTKETKLSLIPYGEVLDVESENLYYSLEKHQLKLGIQTSSSNYVKEEGIVTIKHKAGDLLLLECWD